MKFGNSIGDRILGYGLIFFAIMAIIIGEIGQFVLNNLGSLIIIGVVAFLISHINNKPSV